MIITEAENLEFFKPTQQENTLRPMEYGATIMQVEDEGYDQARVNYKGDRREVLGQLMGEHYWYQGNEWPNCDCCDEKMRFIGQLEQGLGDGQEDMNFGGGVAYVFDCPKGRTGKFLWQC